MSIQLPNTSVLSATQTDSSVGADKQRAAKLASGAHEFEAMMLQQMMKGLQFGQAPGDGGDGEDASGPNGTLQGYGTDALAKSIAAQGGFGIARRIIDQVTAEDAAKSNSRSNSGEGSKV